MFPRTKYPPYIRRPWTVEPGHPTDISSPLSSILLSWMAYPYMRKLKVGYGMVRFIIGNWWDIDSGNWVI